MKCPTGLPHYYVKTKDGKEHLFIDYMDAHEFALQNRIPTASIEKSYEYR